jgi:hypothetical protein
MKGLYVNGENLLKALGKKEERPNTVAFNDFDSFFLIEAALTIEFVH